jgi:methyl coenzyme M reductase subunit D
MTDTEALAILQAQGHATGTPDIHTGRVSVWIRGSEEAIEVQSGEELIELAEGKLSFDDIRAWREDEAAVRAE